jgi:predicted ATP-grasp superfamily ATP-dependent carboligase
MSSIEIIELADIPQKKRTVITGFAGAGFIGNTALMHVVRSKGLNQVAYLHGNNMPPVMVLVDGEAKYSFRVYTDRSDELMFLITEAMISGESAWKIGQELMKWLKRKGVREIIAFDGFPFSQPGANIFGFTTSGKNLQEHDIQPLGQGAISGVNASLMERTLKYKIPWTTLFVPTRMAAGIDYDGAITAVKVLNNMFNMGVETEQLEKISEAISRATRTQQPRRQQQKKGGFLDRILPGDQEA